MQPDAWTRNFAPLHRPLSFLSELWSGTQARFWWRAAPPDRAHSAFFNPILDGGGKFAPPAGFLNIAQKPLGLGSWNFVTFSFYI